MVDQELVELPVTKRSFELLGQFAEHDRRSVTDIVEAIVAREKEYRDVMRRSAEAMQRMQDISIANGNCNMTLDEINAEIEAAREEMRERRRVA